MANLSTGVESAIQSTDWATVAKELIHADPLKFVIAMLIVLVMFFGWIVAKFIDAKFISRQVTKVVTAAGGVQNSNQCAIEANEKFGRDLESKLKAHADSIFKDRQDTREEIAKLRRELNDKLDHEIEELKKALGNLSLGSKTTAEAIAKYQARVDTLDENFNKIITGLKKKAGAE